VGALPRAPGGFRFLVVAIDMFIKWMEAMLVVNIMQEVAVKWVLTDNGTQFKGAKFVS
jgi:hypothetical protein